VVQMSDFTIQRPMVLHETYSLVLSNCKACYYIYMTIMIYPMHVWFLHMHTFELASSSDWTIALTLTASRVSHSIARYMARYWQTHARMETRSGLR
jgi:hypothetical protein